MSDAKKMFKSNAKEIGAKKCPPSTDFDWKRRLLNAKKMRI